MCQIGTRILGTHGVKRENRLDFMPLKNKCLGIVMMIWEQMREVDNNAFFKAGVTSSNLVAPTKKAQQCWAFFWDLKIELLG